MHTQQDVLIEPITDTQARVLDEVFPDRCPVKGTSMEDIWFAAGARSVVNWLIEQKRRAESPYPSED